MHVRIPAVVAIIAYAFSSSAMAVMLDQVDNFQPPGVAGWTVGKPDVHAAPPKWIVNGGPTGTLDNFLQVQGFGGEGAGSKPNMFNTQQWAGDYLAARITAIELDMKYLGQGPETMHVRVGLEGPGGLVWSTHAEAVGPGTAGPWFHAVFAINPASLEGGDAMAVLGNVTKLRLYHAPVGQPSGAAPALDVRIGYDNIRATGEPVSEGDADRDGDVDDDDMSLLLANWGADVSGDPDAGWGSGEFTGQPPVDDDDLSILLANWTGSLDLIGIPEPGTLGLLLVGGLTVLGRRARRSTGRASTAP